MFESFAEQTRIDVIEGSQRESQSLGNNYVGTEHLLLALLAAERRAGSGPLSAAGLEYEPTRAAVATALEGSAAVSEADALRRIGVDPVVLQQTGAALGAEIFIQGLTPQPAPPPGLPPDWAPITPRTKTVLEMAFRRAKGGQLITNDDVLAAILEEAGGLAAVVLDRLGLPPENLAESLGQP